MRILLDGLWEHRRVNAACLLVAVVGLCAAMVGPMYGRSAAEHLLDERVQHARPDVTGVSASGPAISRDQLPVGSTRGFVAPDPAEVLAGPMTEVGGATYDRFWREPTPWLRDDAASFAFGSEPVTTSLYWREGMCARATVEGRCPASPGEALVQEAMAESLQKSVGDTIDLQMTETFLGRKAGPDGLRHEVERSVTRTFTIVGTYSVPEPVGRWWYEPGPVATPGDLYVATSGDSNIAKAEAPALLVAPSAMTSQTFYAGVDRLLDTDAVGLAELSKVQQVIQTRQDDLLQRGIDVTGAREAAVLFDEVRSERSVLASVTLVALVPLVVLALVLLHALVTGAAEVRRAYVALAKLRGHSPGQVWWFGVAEPFAVVVSALPVASLLAWLVTRAVNHWWLGAGAPVLADGLTVTSAAVVTAAALGTAAAGVFQVLREPLAQSLSGAVTRRESGRLPVVARTGVVALACLTLGQIVLVGGSGSGRVLDLLAPMFLALALAVGGALLLVAGARAWTRGTRAKGGIPAFLAARRLARRRDLPRLMLPVVLAVSVTGFAASAWSSADAWRVSRASAAVGAPVSYRADVDPGVLLAVTRSVDPEGRYLAAAAVAEDRRGGMARRVLVDSGRLATVAAWDDSWARMPVSEIARRLAEPVSSTPEIAGGELAVTVSHVELRSDDREAVLWAAYRDGYGRRTELPLGDLLGAEHGEPLTLEATLEECATSCALEQLFLTGQSASETAAQGSFVVTEVAVDGEALDLDLDVDGAWRPARPYPLTVVDPPVAVRATDGGLRVEVFLGHPPPLEGQAPLALAGYAAIMPTTTPDVLPVVATRTADTAALPGPATGLGRTYDDDVVEGFGLSGESVPVRVVARAEALPGVGSEGSMADLQSSLAEFSPPAGTLVGTRLWVGAGTPPEVLAAVRKAGVPLSDPERLSTAVDELRGDAFMLGWRVFLLIGAGSLLLAVFGVVASSTLQSRWRGYEVASLRTIGVPQSALVRAAMLEHTVVLGFAVVLGVAASYVSSVLVVPALDLGRVGTYDPPPLPVTQVVPLLAIGGAALGVTLLVIAVVSRRVVRRAKPASLRRAEPA